MSTIVTDTITGKSTATTITIGSTPVVSASANSMTIRGEGSNQTSIQQGLAKCWVEINPTSLSGTGTTGVGDSFNLTSITDNGTGDHTVNINNDMSSIEYSTPTAANSAYTSASYGLYSGCYNHDAGSFRLHSRRQNAPVDSNFFACTVHGDLS
jgi:hypothetical protein